MIDGGFSANIGGVVGCIMDSEDVEDTVIRGNYVDILINHGSYTAGETNIGGIVGYFHDGTFTNNISEGSITHGDGDNINAGALIGYSARGFVSYSYSSVKVLGDTDLNEKRLIGTIADDVAISGLNRMAYRGAVGEGTKENPYQIATAADLVWISKVVNNPATNKEYGSAYYIQTADIDMRSVKNFILIGTSVTDIAYYFSGTFDGQNKEISNLTINNDWFVGLFGTTWNPTIKNVRLNKL